MEAIYAVRWTVLTVSEFSPDETGVSSGIEAICTTKEKACEIATRLFEEFIQEALYGLEGEEETEMRNYINENSVATLGHKEINYLTGSDRVNITIDITYETVIR
jgi:hypothetical protein